eukprot:scaffold250047_cov44-Prasinocladus_malaysianus.AAC.1
MRRVSGGHGRESFISDTLKLPVGGILCNWHVSICLNVEANSLTGKFPLQWSASTPMSRIEVSSDGLTGTLPPSGVTPPAAIHHVGGTTLVAAVIYFAYNIATDSTSLTMVSLQAYPAPMECPLHTDELYIRLIIVNTYLHVNNPQNIKALIRPTGALQMQQRSQTPVEAPNSLIAHDGEI